jgi:hypothetical protein
MRRMAAVFVPVFTLLMVAVGFMVTTPKAFASSGYQLCTYSNECLNAWGGGPYVNVEGQGPANNSFAIVDSGSYFHIVYEGTGVYGGGAYCVADVNGSQSDARMGLALCSSAPWGYNFSDGPSGSIHNVHWNASLAPAGSAAGSAWYGNSTDEVTITAIDF